MKPVVARRAIRMVDSHDGAVCELYALRIRSVRALFEMRHNPRSQPGLAVVRADSDSYTAGTVAHSSAPPILFVPLFIFIRFARWQLLLLDRSAGGERRAEQCPWYETRHIIGMARVIPLSKCVCQQYAIIGQLYEMPRTVTLPSHCQRASFNPRPSFVLG